MQLLKRVFPYAIVAVMLMSIAAYNGYPLFDWDTHAYVAAGFLDIVLTDRSPVYAFFIRFTSLWTSLWFTIFWQCGIVAWLLVRYLRLWAPSLLAPRLIVVFISLITVFTTVSWYCDILNPHIFAAVLLLSILLYFFDTDASRLNKGMYIFIMVVALCMHNSHFLLLTCFSFLALVFAAAKKYKRLIRKTLVLISIGLLFYCSISLVNAVNGHGFAYSPSSQVFLMGRLASNGILKSYLDDNCGKKNLRLCAVKDALPDQPWEFMWPGAQSPLYSLGIWDSCKKEYDGIITDIFTTPKYLSMFAVKSITATSQELCAIQIGRLPTKDERFMKYFEDEHSQFATSRQCAQGGFDNAILDTCSFFFFLITSLAVLLLYNTIGTKKITQLYCCIIFFLLINAFVMSNASAVLTTYQSRIFWILPATNLLFILNYFCMLTKKSEKSFRPAQQHDGKARESYD